MSGLRSYQIDLIEHIRTELRDHRRILAVMPTGAGKTHTFCTIAQLSTYRNHNVLILVHRSELIDVRIDQLRAIPRTQQLCAELLHIRQQLEP